jgi:hypothetical protein
MEPGNDINRVFVLFLLCEHIMKPTKDTTKSVDDTEENMGQCICTMCPTFKANKLGDYPPGALFCARGRSDKPEKIKMDRCYCLGCDVFIKHRLIIDRLCVNQ